MFPPLLLLCLSSLLSFGFGCGLVNLADCETAVDPWLAIIANSDQRQPLYLGRSPRQLVLDGEVDTGARGEGTVPLPSLLPDHLQATLELQLAALQTALELRGLLHGPPGFLSARGTSSSTSNTRNASTVYVEAWPVRGDWGQLTWAFARYRYGSTESDPAAASSKMAGEEEEGGGADTWFWLTESLRANMTLGEDVPDPFLPQTLHPAHSAHAFATVFHDFLTFHDLYQKPVFGDCIWTAPPSLPTSSSSSAHPVRSEAAAQEEPEEAVVLAAWLSPDTHTRDHYGHKVRHGSWSNFTGSGVACRVLPMPCRIDGVPRAFVLPLPAANVNPTARTRDGTDSRARTEARAGVRTGAGAGAGAGAGTHVNVDVNAKTVPAGVAFSAAVASSAGANGSCVPPSAWPADLEEQYREWDMQLSGAVPAEFPISKRQMTFSRKNSAQPDNQLLDVIAYLQEQYQVMGITATPQPFVWRNITQSNLVAVIPGGGRGADPGARPVVVLDHIDTAFDEDVFQANGSRVSAPGADDNGSATCALLSLARVLRAAPALANWTDWSPVWLLHVTGEEYPGDDLGARYFVSEILLNKQDLKGVLVLDMMGFRNLTRDDRQWQINVGGSARSGRMGEALWYAAQSRAPDFTPVVRTLYDPLSYLFNTDADTFDSIGFDVVLVNEHINLHSNFGRPGYHDSTDTYQRLDFNYAAQITQTVAEAVACLALDDT